MGGRADNSDVTGIRRTRRGKYGLFLTKYGCKSLFEKLLWKHAVTIIYISMQLTIIYLQTKWLAGFTVGNLIPIKAHQGSNFAT